MTDGVGGGGSYFRVLTTCKAISKGLTGILPADLCTHHAHYIKNHRSTVLRRNKNIAVQGGTVSHDNISENRKFIDLCRISDIECGFLFLLNNFLCRVWNMQHTAAYSS